MIILNLLLISSLSFNKYRGPPDDILFKSQAYSIKCTARGEENCRAIKLIDNASKSSRKLRDCYNDDGFRLDDYYEPKKDGASIGFYIGDHNFLRERYLRLDYDIAEDISTGNESNETERAVEYRDALIDLMNATVIYSDSSRGEFSEKDDFLSVLENDIFFPYNLKEIIEKNHISNKGIQPPSSHSLNVLLCNEGISPSKSDKYSELYDLLSNAYAENKSALPQDTKINEVLEKVKKAASIHLGDMVQLSKKSYLYSKPKSNMQTKTYLVRGDKVSLLDEQIDDTGQDWLKINYKGRKNLTTWIKAEVIELINKAVKPQ